LSAIAERYESIRCQVADVADCAGRPPDEITLVAVTKHVGVHEVEAALNSGIVDLGENRVQEFQGKYGLFPDARWHFIGSLQTNKVKDVVGKAYLIHSVDSAKLLRFIDRKAAEAGVVQPLLLQVNISGEKAKHGLLPHDVQDVLVESSGLESVEIKGLMTIAPFGRAEESRWVFRGLRELRDSLAAIPLNGVSLEELSMGMTNDFKVAVEEGSTIVRVGRAIFGR